MSGKQYVVFQEGRPVLFEVSNCNSKVDLSGIFMPSEYELEFNVMVVVDVSIM